MPKFNIPWKMSQAQQNLVWRLWAAACKTQGWDKLSTTDREAKRREVTSALFGPGASWKSLNKTDEAGRLISRLQFLSDKLQGAIEDGNREHDDRRRLLWKFENVQKRQLAVYVSNVDGYCHAIMRERFKLVKGLRTIEDLDARPSVKEVNGELVEGPSQLLQFVMTLDRAIHSLRNKAKHTIQEMNLKAGLAKPAAPAEPVAQVESDLVGEEAGEVYVTPEGEAF